MYVCVDSVVVVVVGVVVVVVVLFVFLCRSKCGVVRVEWSEKKNLEKNGSITSQPVSQPQEPNRTDSLAHGEFALFSVSQSSSIQTAYFPQLHSQNLHTLSLSQTHSSRVFPPSLNVGTE